MLDTRDRSRKGYVVHLASAEGAVRRLERTLGQQITPALTLEGAARILANNVYVALEGAVVLTRVFGVLDYGSLPSAERAYAQRIVHEPIAPDTRVLTLLASRGSVAAWNERKRSSAHLAIPLVSPEFVQTSPMVASLLRELHAHHDRSGHPFASIRTFYVFDARTSTDAQGRHTIPDQDFVREHDVRTVLGVGGTLGATTFALILFARQHVTHAAADQFVPLASEFASLASGAVSRGRFFDAADLDSQ